jgi:hypothetical protein
VARKLTVILHRMCVDGTAFKWSSQEVAPNMAYETCARVVLDEAVCF